MNTYKPSIYISHAWGGESEEIVQKIMKKFQQEGIDITLDKKDLGYRESINDFMKNLGAADAIIIVVSNKYLHSEYCMFELLQIYENKNILHRIFPVVLDEVQIAKSTDRLDLVKYWEAQTKELENKIRELDSISNIEGITEDLNLYQSIRSNIAHLTSILKDINTLNITLHKQSDFDDLFQAVKRKIDENAATTSTDAASESIAPTGQSPTPKKPISYVSDDTLRPKTKRRNFLPLLLGLLGVLLVGYFAVTQWGGSDATNELLSNNSPVESTDQLPPESTEQDVTTVDKTVKQPIAKNPSAGDAGAVSEAAEASTSKKINAPPPITKAEVVAVKVYLDRKIAKGALFVNGRPISDFKSSKTLNVLTAELPVGNQEFMIVQRGDTCRVNKRILSSDQEISLKCN